MQIKQQNLNVIGTKNKTETKMVVKIQSGIRAGMGGISYDCEVYCYQATGGAEPAYSQCVAGC